ncbi:MAG: hypothetical protein HY565_05120 [Candidatus Kerfeldbacteria bacterium]|nr:hypothetical protein [Candidatus Kerfeldbacteria bacterium]
MKRFALLWCIIAACFVTTGVGVLTYKIESNYLAHNSYFYDSVYYQFYNARLAERLHTESRLTVAWDEWVHNDRHPLRTVPLVLLYPAALTQPLGHLYTLLPSLAVLLSLMAWFIYRRTRSLTYSMVGIALFASLPIFYDATYGVAVYWLEWQAAAWVASAGLCLLLAYQQRRWLIGFALCVVAAVLSRYIAAMFLVVTCAPLFLLYLKHSRKRWSDLAWTFGIILVLAGYFLIAHVQGNLYFYSTYGYALNQSFGASAHFIVTGLITFVGRVFPLACILALVVSIIMVRRQWRWLEFAQVAWLGIAPLLLLLALRSVGAVHPLAYSLVGLVLIALAPISWPQVQSRLRWISIIGVGVVVMVLTYQHWQSMTTLQAQATTTQKQFDQTLAAAVAQIPDDTIVWNGFFDEYTWIPAMENYYQTGKLYLPAGQPFFNAHLSAWQGDYPGLTDQQIAERVYAGTAQWVDVAVVLADASPTHTGEWMDNTTSQVVSAYMTEQLIQDSNWERVFTVESFYGTLIGYRNLDAHPENYTLTLHVDPSVRP